jgi:uncharacterized protein
MENSNIRPTQAENRIFLLDALRGFALLGILLMNIPFFGKSYHLNYNLEILGEYTGLNYWSWWAVNGLFEGTMRAIFSMLFGAGAILLLDRIEKKPLDGLTAADFYYRRLIWLLLFGMVNAFVFLWPGDILYTYAICGLFLYPFRKLKPGKLIIFASIFLCFSILQSTSKIRQDGRKRIKAEAAMKLEKAHKKLTESQKNEISEWKTFQQEHSVAHYKSEIKEANKNMRSGYWVVFEEIAGVNTYIQTKDFYFELFFDAMAFFFLGMALFKLRFLTGGRSLQEYAALAFFAYGLGLPLSYWINRTALNNHFDPSLTWQTFTFNLYQIKRLLLSLGHISFFILIFKLGLTKFIMGLLSNVGRMAFSNYLMQSIICTLIFNGYGLGQFGYLERYELYEIVVGVWIFQIVFSWLWLKYFLYGPFEWLWRSLTYWKKQEFYKNR